MFAQRAAWSAVLSLLLITTAVGVAMTPAAAPAEVQPSAVPPNPLPSGSIEPLHMAVIPMPANLGDFVVDRTAAIALGKALFWDMQTGSDGIQACASCHFQAGADSRSKNQLNPGSVSLGGTEFDVGGPNYELAADDFPFHLLADPTNAASAVLRDADDVASSQGVVNTQFVAVIPGDDLDRVNLVDDPVFQVGGVEVRRVEPRNTPSMINAVFNFDNFWDGRAQNIFNGVNPFGDLDPDAMVVQALSPTELEEVRISLNNSSLASQAVGPPLSNFEMSAAGRTFPDVGKKLLSLVPLGKQEVHPEDSVLGALSGGQGLTTSYQALIEQAFDPRWWQSDLIVRTNADGTISFVPRPAALAANEYTLTQYNFSLFWGLSIQLYEATLVSSETAVDRFLDGETDALTAQEELGLDLFDGKARCTECHFGPQLTDASVDNVADSPTESRTGGETDTGFHNIGVRPTAEDVGRGGTAPSGAPLSAARRAGEPAAQVNGAMKTPALRNVELTAPYFHNGGQLTLRQVVEFYNRGGDFAADNGAAFDDTIEVLGLTDAEIDAIVAFLRALTDERLRHEAAPFDHPQLFVPVGHRGDDRAVVVDAAGNAITDFLEIPAVGADGGNPRPKFLTTVPAETFGLGMSTTPDRADSVFLAGRRVSGSIFVYLEPEFPVSSIRQVEFSIDGLSVQIERFAPYDLAGDTDGEANPLDTTTLSDGVHFVGAVVTLANGDVQEVTSRFIVDNVIEPVVPEPEPPPGGGGAPAPPAPAPPAPAPPSPTPGPTPSMSETVGLVDPSQGMWHLRAADGTVESFFFGDPGDVPFMGDWNCDGIDTPGLFRQADGFVYLRNSNTQGIADIRFFFGNPGDIPLAGDFNGDGCDTVSVYRPSTGEVFVINKLGADEGGLGAADISYFFGNPGDKPFVGDFNADGIDTVGLHRESTGLVYFRNSHTQGIAEVEFVFGNPGDRFVAADWDGDGVDSPAVFRPSQTTFFVRNSNSAGIADIQIPFGQPNWLPIAGIFGLG